jgi:hypothetical protein
VRFSHTLARTSAVFDDPNLVSHGGLVPVVALAERAGLPELLAEPGRRVRGKSAAEGELPGGGHGRGRRPDVPDSGAIVISHS